MDRVVAWGLTLCLFPLGLIASAVRTVTALDFENICLEQGAEQLMCRGGVPTAAYDVMLWGYPIFLTVLWFVSVAGVIFSGVKSKRAWTYPVAALVLGCVATAVHVWAFGLR